MAVFSDRGSTLSPVNTPRRAEFGNLDTDSLADGECGLMEVDRMNCGPKIQLIARAAASETAKAFLLRFAEKLRLLAEVDLWIGQGPRS